jgi:1-deoxy-D-xylulose 5-phosphate reductoisomerase
VKVLVVSSQDKDNIEEPLGKEITDMMIDNQASLSNGSLEVVEKRIFFEFVTLEIFVVVAKESFSLAFSPTL